MTQNQILVVDDSPVILRMLSLTLKKEGYPVATAVNGEEALEQIRRLQPNLVFIDAMMPKKDGYEVAQEVRADAGLERQPYIIMLTARGQEADRERAEEVGIDEFMTKPFSPSQVAARVRAILANADNTR
ncbi:MAG: response regulator [Caldilineae bacterium]|nr:MAG: response regulator [Caldilineae bacterium]